MRTSLPTSLCFFSSLLPSFLPLSDLPILLFVVVKDGTQGYPSTLPLSYTLSPNEGFSKGTFIHFRNFRDLR